jgi:hypothetical protein
MAAAAGGGADVIPLFNPQSNLCNIYFSVVISPNLILFLQFSKITVFSIFSLFSVYPFLEQCLYALSCSM